MSYQCLRTTGAGYASIADASQAGLNMGLSDFMISFRIKKAAVEASVIYLLDKWSSVTGYVISIEADTGRVRFHIGDGVDYGETIGTTNICDGRWYNCHAVVDRSSATGMKLYIDGSEETYDSQYDPTTPGSLDNATRFTIGGSFGGLYLLTGLIDELRIFNFGYGGLPADYETYITWLSQGRNWFEDISSYNSGSWNCYADADRTEMVTDSGIENWDNNTPDDWDESGESAGVRDITKETTEKHGGSAAAKLEATDNDGTQVYISQLVSLTANKYYEAEWYSYYSLRTAGTILHEIYNATDTTLVSIGVSSTDSAYTHRAETFKPTVVTSRVYAVCSDETTTGIVYFDDISIKQTGLVGHWKFNGDYLDEGSNNNDLTAGGSGNTFPGYSLKKVRIISPHSVF